MSDLQATATYAAVLVGVVAGAWLLAALVVPYVQHVLQVIPTA